MTKGIVKLGLPVYVISLCVANNARSKSFAGPLLFTGRRNTHYSFSQFADCGCGRS